MAFDPHLTAEKYHLARQTALESNPQGGLCGFEVEWNLLDATFKPLLTVGSGPSQQSFVDYLRETCLSDWMRPFSQLEVFNWMVEWATRPYFSPRGAVFEARLMEAILLNALSKAGRLFGERLYAWTGNLPVQTEFNRGSVPGSWHIAKRRYLERCVDLYGGLLATTGTHSNLSLPDPLLAWDFVHLPASERGDAHLDDYKSQFYITATRLMRAFAALFIATSASTPLQARERDGQPVVVLTNIDSTRNLTFPNPPEIDRPDLYRSYQDYLSLSYDLVRRGIRFGNNNWTPVRARSFAEPVERLIAVTSEQLLDLYSRGLYSLGETPSVDEIAHQIEIQNLMARINIPMARVEVRTDDGGHSMDLEVANLTLKHLLMIRFYADREFGRAFRYDAEDIQRARRNERSAAQFGLRAEVENPFTAKPVALRQFLNWTLEQVRLLAQELDFWEDLQPLVAMAQGAPNTSEQMRTRLQSALGADGEVPIDALKQLAEERERQVLRDVEIIAESHLKTGADGAKLSEFLQRAREDVHLDPDVPVRFRPRPQAILEVSYSDKTSEIVDLAQRLIRIPSVTAGGEEQLGEVRRAATFVYDFLRNQGLQVRYFNQSKYPAVVAAFPGQLFAPVMLSGHFDVVAPEPDESQFTPRVEGDFLWGRGAADMKTVLATYLVWMKDRRRRDQVLPPVNLALIGNEENGESEATGTPHLLELLAKESAGQGFEYTPQLLIAGERTAEREGQLIGEICTKNRGVMRFEVQAHGQRGHTGIANAKRDLTERLLEARTQIEAILSRHLTLVGEDGWKSQARFPFIQVGTPGVYNISADSGLLGVEVRSIPEDDIASLTDELRAYCSSEDLDLRFSVMENGVACDPKNRYLGALVQAVEQASGQPPVLGRKLAGTSARFAPQGQGLVWGQSGVGPHSKDERHFIPSILPYYQALEAFGDRLLELS